MLPPLLTGLPLTVAVAVPIQLREYLPAMMLFPSMTCCKPPMGAVTVRTPPESTQETD